MRTQLQWFALSVKIRQEWSISTALHRKAYEVFLPVYEVRRRQTSRYRRTSAVLFPGYAFCRFDASERTPNLTTPGVKEVVGASHGPTAIPDEEIATLQRVG